MPSSIQDGGPEKGRLAGGWALGAGGQGGGSPEGRLPGTPGAELQAQASPRPGFSCWTGGAG